MRMSMIERLVMLLLPVGRRGLGLLGCCRNMDEHGVFRRRHKGLLGGNCRWLMRWLFDQKKGVSKSTQACSKKRNETLPGTYAMSFTGIHS